MNERQMTAVVGLGVGVGLVIAARQIAGSQGPALGLAPGASIALVLAVAAVAARVSSGRLA